MKKAECIEQYGEAEWDRRLEQQRAWRKAHREEAKAAVKKYREEHPEGVKAASKNYRETHPEEIRILSHEQHRKGGKYYNKMLEYKKTGIAGERNGIRRKHARQYKQYKDIIAHDSQIHHEWVPKTPEYRGLALVEKDQHMHGFIDVIVILDGKITLLTEEQIKKGKKVEN